MIDPYAPLDWPDEPLTPDAERLLAHLVHQPAPITIGQLTFDLGMGDTYVRKALNQLLLRQLLVRHGGKRYQALTRQTPDGAA